MSGYGPYNEEELNAQYCLLAQDPAYEQTVIPNWVARSNEYRDAVGGKYDLAYGRGERDRADFFPATTSNGALLVFIHGGYWQRGDKSAYGFVAKPYNEAGYSVVLINYNLCPSVKMAEIAPQVRRAVIWVWQHAEDLGGSKDSLYLMGHSAGAHLSAWMLATDWPGCDPTLSKDLIKAGVLISGLYDLEPVRHCVENAGLMLENEAEARAVSLIDHPPATDAPQLIAWGLDETDEFRRQNDEHYERLSAHNSRIERFAVVNREHTQMVEETADGKSELVSRILTLLGH